MPILPWLVYAGAGYLGYKVLTPKTCSARDAVNAWTGTQKGLQALIDRSTVHVRKGTLKPDHAIVTRLQSLTARANVLQAGEYAVQVSLSGTPRDLNTAACKLIASAEGIDVEVRRLGKLFASETGEQDPVPLPSPRPWDWKDYAVASGITLGVGYLALRTYEAITKRGRYKNPPRYARR